MKPCRSFQSLVLVITGLCMFYPARAQQIANHSFESWSLITYFEEPDSFLTSNMQAWFSTGSPNVTPTTDAHQGVFAARLETVPGFGEYIPGVMLMGEGGPMGLAGGIPYTGRPDSISAWVKYASANGDSALIMVLFKQQGNIIGDCQLTIPGNLDPYTRLVSQVNWYIQEIFPDTILMVVFSSVPGGTGPPGSVLYLDDLTMENTPEQVPNHGFEDWTPVSSEEPDEWFTSNVMTLFGSGIGITRDTLHADGMYSARITNRATMDGDVMSFVTNGGIGDNGPTGGSPVLQNPEKITFWYRYEPVNSDTAMALGMLTRYDVLSGSTVVCDSVMVKMPAAAGWTYFELDFGYSGNPPADTVLFAAASGLIDDEFNPPQEGSTLWIDQVEVAYPVQTGDSRKPERISLFPNPARGEIFITGPAGTVRRVEVLSADGRILRSFPFGDFSGRIRLDLRDLDGGLYLYRIHTQSDVRCGKLVRQ